MQTQQVNEILSRSPLLRGIEPREVGHMLENASHSVERFEAGEVLARRDTAYSGLIIILEGWVRGEITASDGRTRVIEERIEAPQLIAPAFLFGGYNRLPIDVVAGGEGVTVVTIHRGAIFEMMQENTIVLSNFVDIISNRANYFSRKIYALSVLMLTEKIAAVLLASAGVVAGSADVAPLDVAAIARELDVTRAVVEQTLRELQQKRLIEVSKDGRSARILDRQGLEGLANS